RATTFASLTAPPEGAVTVPWSVAVDCASAGRQRQRTPITRTSRVRAGRKLNIDMQLLLNGTGSTFRKTNLGRLRARRSGRLFREDTSTLRNGQGQRGDPSWL